VDKTDALALINQTDEQKLKEEGIINDNEA